MNKYLADTTVVVEMLRGNSAAKRFLESRPEVSLVTAAELIQGARNREDLRVVERTLELLPQAGIDGKAAVKAVELLKKYHLSQGLLFLDALVAAAAIIRKRILVTANVKDFRFIEGLKVVNQTKVFTLSGNGS